MIESSFFLQSIDSVFSKEGICSKRAIRNFLKQNSVCVNNHQIFDSKELIDTDNDEIFINGKKIDFSKHIYLIMNKPIGFVCSTVSDSHKTVYDLLRNHFSNEDVNRLKCAGRLDCDTKGLLIFSTNGSFVNKITSPDFSIKKKYLVQLKNPVSKDEQVVYSQKVLAGIDLPQEKKSLAFKTLPGILEWISDSLVCITIKEGRFHEVRRIFLTLGNFVSDLTRIQIGELFLKDDLHSGQIKILSRNEFILY